MQSENAGQPALAEYVVVLRARSAARYLPEGGFEFNVAGAPALVIGAVRIRAFTRWVAAGNDQLPRELTIEVRGLADSLDEATERFYRMAQPVALMTSFVANVRVGVPEVFLAYECTPDSTERPFLEVFLPDETGGVSDGRMVNVDLMVAATPALLAVQEDDGRVSRALRHYELALRNWFIGGEWLALNHLYIAAETLAPVVIARMTKDRAMDEAALAESLGVPMDDPDVPWRNGLARHIRKHHIFAGDVDTYRAAGKGRNGMEHGHLALSEVNKHALASTEKTFGHIRRTICEVLDLPDDVRDKLMAITPRDVESKRKMVRGRLVGSAADPAQEGELYPRLEWTSNIQGVDRDGDAFRFNSKENFTVRTHPAIAFDADAFAVMGRAEEGGEPVEVKDLDVEHVPAPESTKLLQAVMPLVEEAAATQGALIAPIFMIAFNLFCEGLALFQAAKTLIDAKQPVEAVTLLRGLVVIASRFEQMTDADGPGIGVMVRLFAPELPPGDRAGMEAWASQAGVTVPDALPGPSDSAIWASLTHEMGLAHSVLDGTLGAVGLHVKVDDPEHMNFNTCLTPGPVTEMISAACVMAQLELLKHAASLLGWTINSAQVDDLLAQAQALNHASAHGIAEA